MPTIDYTEPARPLIISPGENTAAAVTASLAAIGAADAISTITISGFRAEAQSNDTNPTVVLDATIHGVKPDRVTATWDGYTANVPALPYEVRSWDDQTDVIAIGDSMLDGKWAESAAAELGLTLTNVAVYSSGGKQRWRLGIKTGRLYFTLAGAIPAAGGSVGVTVINGAAPAIYGDYRDLFNAECFLTTTTGDTSTAHNTITGIMAGRHVRISVPNAGTPTYTLTAIDDYAGTTAVDDQTLFVPDNLALLKTHEVWIRLTQNTFYGEAFDHDVNPQVFADIQAILDETAGNRVIIIGLTSQLSWATDGYADGQDDDPLTAVRWFNAQLRARWPAQALYIPGTGNNFDYILAHAAAAGISGDATALAAGVIPPSRMADDIHLNSLGQAEEKAALNTYRLIQAKPPAPTQSTVFTLDAVGTNPRTGEKVDDAKVAVTQTGGMAALTKDVTDLADQVQGATANSAYRPTLAAAVADLAVGTYFSSRDMDAVGPHAGVRWNYKRIASAPYWQALDAWAAKGDVALGSVDNTADADKPVSTAQASALALKANLTDLTKGNVGLGNVDNTSDANKPVSTAQAALIDQKTAQIAYVDFTTKADGLPPSNLDTGQVVDYTFNATGRRTAIESGRLVVYNKAAAGSGGLADYYQSDLGAPVVRVGCEWTMPAGTDDGLANITYAAWNGIYEGGGTTVPKSWVHMSIIPGTGATGTAQWFIVRGVAAAYNIISIKSQTFTNPAADGAATWSSEAVLDAEGGIAYASLPDGSVMSLSNAEIATFCAAIGVSPAPTFADLSATVIMCEHYCNTGANTAKFGGIKNLYGETQSSVSRALKSKNPDPLNHFKRIKSARDKIPPSAPTPTIYAPTTALSVATTTSMANIDGLYGTLAAVAGVNGKIIWRVSAYYEWTGTDTVFWRLAGNAGNTPLQAADVGVSGTKRTVHGVFVSTGLNPGQSYTMTLQHSAVTGGLATLKAGGSGGAMVPPLTIAATPA